MKLARYFFPTLIIACITTICSAQTKVEQFKVFELSLPYKANINGFTQVSLKAIFTNNDTAYHVNGFYNGNGNYIIRFMPTATGQWKYTTISNISKLNSQKGTFECTPHQSNNHGPVKVSNTYHFAYADGTPYYPFGTTIYGYALAPGDIQALTKSSLQQSGFNKVRCCVFPLANNSAKDDPASFPFVIKKTTKNEKGEIKREWDFTQFNPEYFTALEKSIANLDALGIETDLILFHPYDKGRWGFDAMPKEANIRYIQYITARLAAYKNIWWSLSNEWDYVKAKSVADWNELATTVVQHDPYRHLLSIHGATGTYFDYWKPAFTHISVQDEAPVQSTYAAALVRNIYHKPVIFDEVGYEGNLDKRWGRYSPQEMTYLVTNGVMAGTYVTHGECITYHNELDTMMLAVGGLFKGDSWKRIAFLRKIIEACPKPLQVADISRDYQTSTAGEGYYFVWLGKDTANSWAFNLPVKNAVYPKLRAGKKFTVDIIDVWNMTIAKNDTIYETVISKDGYRVTDKNGQHVTLPSTPYILLRIQAL